MLREKEKRELTKSEKAKLVNIAWEQVKKFIKDWQKSPYEYSTERDIQADIANRLKRAYKIKDWKTFFTKSKYPDTPETYDKKGQINNRVCCEPLFFYKRDERPCNPDIVVFDDCDDPERLPNEDKEGIIGEIEISKPSGYAK